MKKFSKLIAILFCIFSICACIKKENNNYNLIELTTEELIAAMEEENVSFNFATIDMESEKGQNYYDDLKKLSSKIKQNIYYVDGTHTYFWDDETFYIYTGIDIKNNIFYLIQEGQIVNTLEYKNYEVLYNNLKSQTFPTINTIISDKEKKQYLNEAITEYNNGDIISSFQLLQKAWTLTEAKEYYEKSDYFKLFNEWIYYNQKDNNEIIYKSLVFYDSSNIMYEYTYEGQKNKFEEPIASSYTSYYYYIKDNKIYTSTSEDGKYKSRYEIISIAKTLLTIKDKKQVYNLLSE